MKVAVWDTYVTKKDGRIMHFDIIAPEGIKDPETIYKFGRDYLAFKGESGQPLTAKECTYCHVETARPEWAKAIEQQGYAIYEMKNCD